MWINKKDYIELTSQLTELKHQIKVGVANGARCIEERDNLKAELVNARNLQSILDTLVFSGSNLLKGNVGMANINYNSITDTLTLSDSVPILVDDYFSKKKIIKQTANKVVRLDVKGNALYHHTEKSNDEGFEYVLDREVKK